MKNLNFISKNIDEHKKAIQIISKKTFLIKIFTAAKIISNSIKKNKTIFWCGNGGSASDSMHLSAELIGRFKKKRRPFKSISLANDAAALTCIANDYGFENIYSRQIEALGGSGDVLIAISTSGKSKNIINSINIAHKKKMRVITLLGNNGGRCKKKKNLNLIIGLKTTSRIQEMHILVGHILCDLIENNIKK